MKPEYHPGEARECDDCGAVSTLGELTPQKRLLDAPALWVCPACIAKSGSHAAIYQCAVHNGRMPAAQATWGGTP